MTDQALALIRGWRTSLARATPGQALDTLREAIVMSEEADYEATVGAVRGLVEACLPESVQVKIRSSMRGEIALAGPSPPIRPAVALQAARAEVAQLRARREARAAREAAAAFSIRAKAELVARCTQLEVELVGLAGELGVPVESLATILIEEGSDVGRFVG